MSNAKSTKPLIGRHYLEAEKGLVEVPCTFHIRDIDTGLEDSLDLWSGHPGSVPQGAGELFIAAALFLFVLFLMSVVYSLWETYRITMR